MKPCANRKHAIALHAIQNLETGEQAALLDHLAACAGCCEYLKELQSLSRDLSSMETQSRPEAALTLHNRIKTSLRNHSPMTPVFGFAGVLRIKRKIAIAIFAGATGALLLIYRPHPVQIEAKSDAIKASGTTKGSTSFSTTFAQYHRLAGFANDELDAALNCSSHGGQSLSRFSISSGQDLGSRN